MKILYRLGADFIWLLHFVMVLIALFGWLVPSIWLIYIAVLVGTLISTLTLGYCIFSKWEYDLRKKIDPLLTYDFPYASYYTFRLTQGRLSGPFLAKAGVIFVSLSLVIQALLFASSISAAWFNFAIVAVIQFLLFIVGAFYEKRLSDAPRVLALGALIGIVFGLPLDLIAGKYFGLYTYTLGFSAIFLTLNWVLLNGLFAANTLLAQRLRLPYFFLWSVVLMAVHEVPNYFFRVWTWQFSFPPIEHVIVLLVGYFVGAAVGAVVWRVCFGYRFTLLV